MRDFYIFDIPVYRCAEEDYYAGMEESTAKHLDALFASSGVSREKAPDTYRFAEEYFRKSYGGPWDFNQVVGWIRLYAEASHVGGHLWWVDAKRLHRNMRKTSYVTTLSNILATYFTPDDDSTKIFNETLVHLENLANQKPFKGRYVDLETFRNIGPFISWRELLNHAAQCAASRRMKFFIPAAKDELQAEEVWQATKEFAVQNLGWEITNRRIFSITYGHEGKVYHAEVGKPDPRVGELVIAILESNAYLVCTGNRGVIRGEPILVGREEVREIKDFES